MHTAFVFSRRTLLKSAATLAIATTFPASITSAEAPFGPFKVGVHSYSLRKFPFDKMVQTIKDLGVKYMSMNPVHLPLDSTPEQRANAKKTIEDAGLILMTCGVISFKKDKADDARNAFQYAKDLGIRTIAANPDPDALDLVETLVKEFDIRIAIHNHGPESLYQTPEDILKAVGERDPRMGACADIGHFERSNILAADALKALRGRIHDLHLKDINERQKKGHSVIIGTGVIDMNAVIKELRDNPFDGMMGIEYEEEPENPVPSITKTLDAFKKGVAENA